MKFKPCTGASFHHRRRLSRHSKLSDFCLCTTAFLLHYGLVLELMHWHRCCSPSSLQQKMLLEVLTDAISAYLVSKAGRTFISTTVPQVLGLLWISGTFGSGSLPKLISVASLMALTRKKGIGMGSLGGWGGWRRVLSPLALLSSCQRRVLVPAAARLVLPDRKGPSCQTQGPAMTIGAVLLVIAGGSSRSPNSTSAGLIFRGMGAEIYISSRKRKENVCISRTWACVL